MLSSVVEKVRSLGEQDYISWKQAAVIVSILIALGGVGWYGHLAQPHTGAVSESRYLQDRIEDRESRKESADEERQYKELQMKYFDERFNRIERMLERREQ